MRGKQAIFNLEIKKKSGLSNNPDIHLAKVFSSGYILVRLIAIQLLCSYLQVHSDLQTMYNVIYPSMFRAENFRI